jgi:hypothetical protein
MPITIIRPLEQLPSYPVLCKLAEKHHVRVSGDEHAGSFSCGGLEGNYEIRDDGIRGKFAGHGVTGEFEFEMGKGAVTVTDKPFWLPEALLRRKVTEGLDALWKELADVGRPEEQI